MKTQHGEHYYLEISFLLIYQIEKSFIRSPCNQVDVRILILILIRSPTGRSGDRQPDNFEGVRQFFFLHWPPLIFIDIIYWQLWRCEAYIWYILILYIDNFEGVKQGKIEIEGDKGVTIEGFQVNWLARLVWKGTYLHSQKQHPYNCLVPKGRKDSLLIEVQGQVLVIPMVRQPRKTRLDLQNFSSLQNFT